MGHGRAVARLLSTILIVLSFLPGCAGTGAKGGSVIADSTDSPPPPKSSAGFRDPVTGMEFVFVKGGCYRMGDFLGVGKSDERPVHEVCVSDFHMGMYEVTQRQWREMMGNNPSFYKGDGRPVTAVKWLEIQAFIMKLNLLTGRKYRLPTEAEWEYAARSGGKPEEWAGTNDVSSLGKYAWYSINLKEITPSPFVGKKRPNGLGLYDMSGSVSEYCGDWYDANYYSSSPRNDPGGPAAGMEHVTRGGSWLDNPTFVRTTGRGSSVPQDRVINHGFRLVLPAGK